MTGIDPEPVHVWVHTWWGRDNVRQATLDSLDASDLRGKYAVYRQPKGAHRCRFFLQTIDSIRANPAWKYSLRIEDDVLVNKHFLYNICTWHAYGAPRFGAAFFSHRKRLSSRLRTDQTSGLPYFVGYNCHFGGAVLVPTSVLTKFRRAIERKLYYIENVRHLFAAG